MMNKTIFSIFLALGMLLFMGACKTKKPHTKKETAKEQGTIDSAQAINPLLSQVILNKNFSEGLSFSANADYNDGKQSAELNMEVLAKQKSFVFLTVKALGFVNVARVMIQPDSIRILDLINRTYISASYRYLQKYSSAPIGFEQIQNMVWANALFDPSKEKTRVDSTLQTLWLITDLKGTLQKVAYSSQLKTTSVVLSEQGRAQEMLVRFSDFRTIENFSYPHEIVINIQAEKKVDCKFTISNFAPNLRKEPQFVVPRSYKVQVF